MLIEKEYQNPLMLATDCGRERQMSGSPKAVKNTLTADRKPFNVFLAGRVGWRGVEEIRLAGIGSARHGKEVGLQSEVR